MGEGTSRKKLSGFDLEAVRVSAEERKQGGSRARPTAEAPTPAPLQSQEDEQLARWRGGGGQGNGEGVLQHNGTWTNAVRANSSTASASTDVGPDEPIQKLAGRKEGQKDLTFEEFKDILIDPALIHGRHSPHPEKSLRSLYYEPGPPAHSPGDPPLSAQTEKRCDWSSLDAWLEPRAQDGTQSLTKGTQTEAAGTGHGDRLHFPPGRDHDSVYMLNVAESSEKVIQQGLREFFGFLKILVHVPTIFMTELIHFLSRSVFQVLVVGLLTAVGDEVLEPLLAALFGSILQPLMVFLLNVSCGIRNLSYPLIDILRGVCVQVAVVLRAFRLVEINNHPKMPLAEKV